MIYEIGLTLEVATAQKAAALRDKLANYLANDPDAEVISWSAARRSTTWEVWGVDVSTSTPFTEVVEADDETAARALIVAPKIIAVIRAQR